MKLLKRTNEAVEDAASVLKVQAQTEAYVARLISILLTLASVAMVIMIYFLSKPGPVKNFELIIYSVMAAVMLAYHFIIVRLQENPDKNWMNISLCKVTMMDLLALVGMATSIVRLKVDGVADLSFWMVGVVGALCVFVNDPYVGWSALAFNMTVMGITGYVFRPALSLREGLTFVVLAALGSWVMSIRYRAALGGVKAQEVLRRAVEESEEARDEALRANNVKSAFLSHMSHELRTPIGAIIGMNSAILKQRDMEKIKEYSGYVDSASRSLLAIVNDILDISKIEAGKLEVIPVEYDLSSLIFDTVNMMKDRATGKGLKFITRIDPRLPHRLYGDDQRIKQVILNLLSNAVKYTDKGSVTLSMSGHTNGNRLSLDVQVWDTGAGIKEEDLDKLFIEFQRIEEKKNRNVEGTGLGINIVCSMLNLMGSKLNVSSTYGEGSCFSFIIEQDVVDPEPIGSYEERVRAAQKSLEGIEAIDASGMKLLVVDDNPVNRRVFSVMLEDTGAEIDEAESGAACLRMLRKKKYDLVFLDHYMPEMDGIETLRHIRNDDSKFKYLPVIALTANAALGGEDLYSREGFSGYLTKPVDLRLLQEIVLKYK